MARDAVERGTQTRELGRTVDYVDDVQDAVDILVRAGVDEPRSLTSLTRESRVDLMDLTLNSALDHVADRLLIELQQLRDLLHRQEFHLAHVESN